MLTCGPTEAQRKGDWTMGTGRQTSPRSSWASPGGNTRAAVIVGLQALSAFPVTLRVSERRSCTKVWAKSP